MTWQKLNLKKQYVQSRLHTRRFFLKQCTYGLGALALGQLTGSCGSKSAESDPGTQSPHFPPRIRSVIYLHMAGAPSQLELFDYKPELARLHGQPCPPSLLSGKRFAFLQKGTTLLGPQAHFRQRGQSGAWVSDHLPHLATVADELTFLKAVQTDQFNHAPAQLFFLTGDAQPGRPSFGSWVMYGLGSENQNLPGFIVLTSGGNHPDAGGALWSSGFLPAQFQGVHCQSHGDPVLYLQNPNGVSRDLRRAELDAITAINEETYREFSDEETVARLEQYELAFRMQMTAPEAMDLKQEPEHILSLYGAEPGKASFANNALLARRLVERGVRFVQLFDWGWDSHGTEAADALNKGFLDKCRQTDRATAALLTDLKQRGLLEETLVVWSGEFGRTPMRENRHGLEQAYLGRDHHPYAFTLWMAGGGLQAGTSYGETDDIGLQPVSGAVSVHDVQATILHLLGLDHTQLRYLYQGRDFRLTDVGGQVIHPVLA